MAPLEQAFGWTRAEVSTGPFLLGIAGGFGILFSGALADRFTARRIIMPGLLLFALTMGALSLASANLWQWYATWMVIAIAQPLVTPAVWTTAIVTRFATSRGLALAVALAGTGLSSTLAPILIEHLIEAYGWRTGYLFYPLFAALVILPLAALFYDRPRIGPVVARATPAQKAAHVPLGTVMRSAPFLALLAASILFALGLMALMAHFVPIASEAGLSRGAAVAAFSFAGLCSIAGRLTTGYLLDRLSSTLVAAVTFLLPLVAVVAAFISSAPD
mgnify:CR=1 FL=1